MSRRNDAKEESTYIYLTCRDHSPVIWADGESGRHLTDLPQLRQDIANRGAIVYALHLYPSGSRYRHNTTLFLAAHPHCNLGIVDEYGREHPITEEESEES